MSYEDLTLDEIRNAERWMRKNSETAFGNEAYSLADMLLRKADSLWDELVRRIQAEDPYTTEADIRYFEGK